MKPSVVVLSFNAERTIGATVEAALRVSDDVHVVDSYSTDRTLQILRTYPVHLAQHPFENYARQRNWAIRELPLRYDWELHLDADERLSPELIQELEELPERPPWKVEGYFLPRVVRFLGRILRHGGLSPTWHLRLFRRGKGRCEDRLYDQHFYVEGPAGKLRGVLIDDIRMDLSEWTTRHNRWADAEVAELRYAQTGRRIGGKWRGNPVEQKRALRGVYYRLPPFLRPWMLFGYRYVLRLGFLDGTEGLIFYVLQTAWFRFLIDAKLWATRFEEVGAGVPERSPGPIKNCQAAADALEQVCEEKEFGKSETR